MKPTLLHIEGLEALHLASTDPEVALVILHGYGANMHDLFPLWQLWQKENFNWYFPNGSIQLSMGPYGGRSWTSIDIQGLEQAMREGRHRDLKDFVPPEYDATMAQLEKFLIELKKTHKRLIVGGFSQGAMCASHLVSSSKVEVDGLILLSGNLIAESKFPSSARSLPFYQSHGTSDAVLSVQGAKNLEAKLKSMGLTGDLELFSGGHEIPPTVIQGVTEYLKRF
jgi:phospholipase/carboxylesterase